MKTDIRFVFRVRVRPVEVVMRHTHRDAAPFAVPEEKTPKTTFAAILDAILARTRTPLLRSIARNGRRLLLRASRSRARV